jgi:hypothetical protein
MKIKSGAKLSKREREREKEREKERERGRERESCVHPSKVLTSLAYLGKIRGSSGRPCLQFWEKGGRIVQLLLQDFGDRSIKS